MYTVEVLPKQQQQPPVAKAARTRSKRFVSSGRRSREFVKGSDEAQAAKRPFWCAGSATAAAPQDRTHSSRERAIAEQQQQKQQRQKQKQQQKQKQKQKQQLEAEAAAAEAEAVEGAMDTEVDESDAVDVEKADNDDEEEGEDTEAIVHEEPVVSIVGAFPAAKVEASEGAQSEKWKQQARRSRCRR